MRHHEKIVEYADTPVKAGTADWILADTDDGAITVNLKYSQDTRQDVMMILNKGSSGNDITVGVERSGDLINGATTLTISDGELFVLYADDVQWLAKQLFPGQELSTSDTPTFEAIQFDTTPSVAHAEGQVHWDEDDKTLEVDMAGGNVHLQIGLEMLIRAKNDSGTNIVNGNLVYISGGTGSQPEISLADKDALATALVIGMATEDIDDGQFGYVTTKGLVRDVDTLAYAVGTLLWLGDDGAYTSTKPTAPDYAIAIGQVVRQSETEGVIHVTIVGVPALRELSDVYSPSGPSANNIIYWDAVNSRWLTGNPPQFTASGTDYPVGLFERLTTATNDTGTVLVVRRKSSNDIDDGFGGAYGWQIMDDADVANLIATVEGVRDGADNSGMLRFNVLNAGSWYRPMSLHKDGSVRLGNVGDGNYLEVEADGTTVNTGNATVWDDQQVNLGTVGFGASAPTWVSYKGSKVLAFNKAQDNQIYFSAQLSHKYKIDSAIEFHLHTVVPDDTAGDVKWTFTYSLADINDDFPAETSVSALQTIAANSADNHQYFEHEDELGSTSDGVSAFILCSLTREGTDGTDDYDNDIYLLGCDFHIEIDTQGSRTETSK